MKYLPGEKFLMPFQDQPLNGDKYAVEKFLWLRDKFNIKTAFELGTCVGGTTRWLSQNFEKVIGIEIMPEYLDITVKRIGTPKANVIIYEGSTVDMLPEALEGVHETVLMFVDSHWSSHNPLLEELAIIAEHNLKPVLVIHDFLVPGHKDLGYDVYGDIVYEWKWIQPSIEKIYGKDYVMEHNSKATGAKRGICYVYPKEV